MLGRLVTWMRVIGCDVAYEPGIPDGRLVERAVLEGRIVLTRDTELVKRAAHRGRVCLIRGDRYFEQFRQVIGEFGIDPRRDFLTRCLRCNTPLAGVSREEVSGKVPPYVFQTQDQFLTCPDCRRISWRATHQERMLRELEAILSRENHSL
jgi:hypothetical protein